MQSTGIQLRIGDMLFALQKRWILIISLTLLGFVFGLLLSGLTYVQESVQLFNINGSVSVTTRDKDNRYLGGNTKPATADVHLAEELIDPIIYLMRSDRVVNQVINDLELLGITPAQVRSSMTLTQEGSTQILKIRISWTTPEEGLALWQALVDTTNQLMPQVLMTGRLELINEPVASKAAQSSSVKSTSVLLAVIGFAAGVGYAVMELLMRPTLTNVKDVETVFGLETIGIIPKDPTFFKKKGSLLVKEEVGSSPVLQNFSSSAYILRNRLNAREKHHCFYVTSSIKQEGRSTVAANLAIQLSDMEHRTLLIDFDTHNPSLGTLFLNNIEYSRSLNALYRGEINEVDAITTLTGYLDLLPMVLEHGSISMDSMIVDMIKRLKEKYEYIILDAPPVGKEADTLSLNQVANSVLFVIGYDNSTIPEIQDSLEKLDKSGIRVIGCIVNAAQTSVFSLSMDEVKSKSGQMKNNRKMTKEQAFMDVEAEKADVLTQDMLKTSQKIKGTKKRKSLFKKEKKEREAPANKHTEKKNPVGAPISILEELSAPDLETGSIAANTLESFAEAMLQKSDNIAVEESLAQDNAEEHSTELPAVNVSEFENIPEKPFSENAEDYRAFEELESETPLLEVKFENGSPSVASVLFTEGTTGADPEELEPVIPAELDWNDVEESFYSETEEETASAEEVQQDEISKRQNDMEAMTTGSAVPYAFYSDDEELSNERNHRYVIESANDEVSSETQATAIASEESQTQETAFKRKKDSFEKSFEELADSFYDM